MAGRGSDRGRLVHPLSCVRQARGWTLQDVVEVIAARLGNSAARREKAWKWEHWGVVPDRISQLALAAELGISAEEVTGRPWPAWLPDGDPVTYGFSWTATGSVAALEEAVDKAGPDRRSFMKITGSGLLLIAADWLRVQPGELSAVVNGGRVSQEFLTRVEEGLPRLRLLEAARGGCRVRRLIDAELGMVSDILAGCSYTTAVGTRLHRLAGELGRVAGWASLDAGLH